MWRYSEERDCTMANYVNFHSQLASIMEVLANAAVAEICQLVDDGYTNLRLEVSRTQRENLALRSKLRLMEVRSRERYAKKTPLPPLVVTCSRRGHHAGEDHHTGEDHQAGEDHHAEDHPTSAKRNEKTTMLENSGSQVSKSVVVSEPPLEADLVVVKAERLEEELEDHQMAPNSSTGLPSRCVTAQNKHLNTEVSLNTNESEMPRISLSGHYETEDFTEPGAQQQEGEEGGADGGCNTYAQQSQPLDQDRGPTSRSSGPSRAGEVTGASSSQTQEGGGAADVDPCGSFSMRVAAESSSVQALDAEPVDTDVPLAEAAPCMTPVWKQEVVEEGSTPVKMEAEMQPSWAEVSCFGTNLPLVSVPRKEREETQINNSKLLTIEDCRVSNSNSLSSLSHHRESESAESKSSELDTGGFDSSSFDDLFSSPEVARSLIAPNKDSTDSGGGLDERLSSSSFSFLTSGFGNPSSSSDSLADAGFRNPPSDSRNRVFPSSPARVFSCQQCGRLFSNSRDLVVHQRSHAGERLFHCPLCKKPFLHLHQLKTHQRVHTGEKPFSCTQCGKRFSQSSHIKRHMSVHTGEKRYSCGLCGKRFSQSCSLKVHQAVHTGERPYSCTQCGKSFSVLGNLVRHQSVHIRK
ncbi:uncharacterized protein ACJ7VT_018949 [Polymixia lowei]